MSLRPLLAALLLAATSGQAAVCGADHPHASVPALKSPASVPAAPSPRSKCDAPTKRAAKPAKATPATERPASRRKEQDLGLCDGS